MLFRLLLLLLLSSLSFRCLAQAYEPGWLLLKAGDTLHVEVENSFWQEPPTLVRFRRTATVASETVLPRQLRSFGLKSGRYFRFEMLPVDHAADTRFDRLSRGNFTDIRPDSLLAEVLLAGPVSVLRVYRPATTHYFFVQAGQPPLALCARQYLRQSATDGAWRATDGNNYRGLLTGYFQQCPAAVLAVQHAAFTASDLLTVAQAYNETCSPTHQSGRNLLAQARPRHRVALRGGLLAGARYNRLKSPTGGLAGACTDCQVRPFGGLYADLLLPSRRSAVYGELSLSRFRNYLGQTYYDYNPPRQTDEIFDYRAWLGTARLGIRYIFPLPREQQVIAGMGLELNHVLGVHYTRRYSTGLPLDPNTEFVVATTTLLPNLSLGWRRQRCTLSLDIQSYALAGDTELINLFVGSGFGLRLGLGYQLGRNPDAPRPATPTSASAPR